MTGMSNSMAIAFKPRDTMPTSFSRLLIVAPATRMRPK